MSEVVWAEVRAHFPTEAKFLRAMETLGITYVASSAEAAVRLAVPGLVIEREGGSVNTWYQISWLPPTPLSMQMFC